MNAKVRCEKKGEKIGGVKGVGVDVYRWVWVLRKLV